jgi:hypothetical protein
VWLTVVVDVVVDDVKLVGVKWVSKNGATIETLKQKQTKKKE